MEFRIYNGERCIGWSSLEHGDPPMGVAFGEFHPSENYAEIQPLFQAYFQSDPDLPEWVRQGLELLDLRAVAETGETISDHVHFDDATGVMADEPPQATVWCRTSEIYQTYFPEHVRNYESSFRRGG